MAFNFARAFLQFSNILRSNIINQGRLLLCYQCQQNKRFSFVSYNVVYPILHRISLDETHIRYYAKGKDKSKGDKKGKKKVAIDESILDGIINVDELHKQMQKCVENLKEDYIKNLSLRSSAGSIESIQVKFDGSDYKLQELAQVVRQNPKSVILNMSAFPQAIPAVLEAIEKSGMNLNPQQDGTKLFIPVPKVTKELRENLAKSAKAHFIKCRGYLKDTQTKYLKKLKSKETNERLSTDLSHNAADQITAICDSYVAQAEKLFALKESELKGESN